LISKDSDKPETFAIAKLDFEYLACSDQRDIIIFKPADLSKSAYKLSGSKNAVVTNLTLLNDDITLMAVDESDARPTITLWDWRVKSKTFSFQVWPIQLKDSYKANTRVSYFGGDIILVVKRYVIQCVNVRNGQILQTIDQNWAVVPSYPRRVDNCLVVGRVVIRQPSYYSYIEVYT